MYEYEATVLRVIDGDTIECNVQLGFHVTVKEKFRLADIDAPEMNTSEGRAAYAALLNKIQDLKVLLKSQKQDKYGRWLAEVFLEEENINQWLIENGYAVPYLTKRT